LKINVRENRRDNQEWKIQDEDKLKQKTQHNMCLTPSYGILYELSCENELLKLLVLVRVTIRSTDRLISRWTLNHVFIFTKQRCKRIHCGLYCQLLCCRILRHHWLCQSEMDRLA
jgi:hypothetical protein